jgi:putative nucleotidyltransferase with HDIG domain
VYGFAYVFVKLGWTWTAVLVLPLFGLRQLYKTNWQLQTINEELLQLMVAAIEARDPYTSGHSQRVADYTEVVCRAAGLSPRATERVYAAALLHDVGKIHEEFAPILRKPSRLTDAEFSIMKTHSAKGAALVGKVSQFQDLVASIRSHHESWDGAGYPDGLKASEIPLWARVIAIADTVDAMTTDRPYRQALSADAVRSELVRQAGRQFDPHLASAVASDRMWPELRDALAANSAARQPAIDLGAIPRHSATLPRPVGT